MTLAYEAHVSARFDTLQARFKRDVDPSDVRLRGVLGALPPVGGLRLLDLGCGKGRFSAAFRAAGADVIGVDLSAGMLADGVLGARVRASALRLPFGPGAFDAVVAVELIEHLPPWSLGALLAEARRVLQPGGRVVVVDKNARALDARRPWLPAIVVKSIDEVRGLWMYRRSDPVREHWFFPGTFRRLLGQTFEDAAMRFLLSPDEARRGVFRRFPAARKFVLWTGRVPGVSR